MSERERPVDPASLGDPVPVEVVEAARRAFFERSSGSELAAIASDSTDPDATVAAGHGRKLHWQTDDVTIHAHLLPAADGSGQDLTVTADGAALTSVTVHTLLGDRPALGDDQGAYRLPALSSGPARLHVVTTGSAGPHRIHTDWVSI